MKLTAIIIIFFLAGSNLFSQWNLIKQTDYQFYDVFFLNNDTGFVVGRGLPVNPISYNDPSGIIFKTKDGGITWDSTILLSAIYSIRFIDADTGFAGSDDCFFYQTNNGGETWDTVFLNTEFPCYSCEYFSSMYFFNCNEGYAINKREIGNHTLFHTVNGGISWNEITYSNLGPPPCNAEVFFPTKLIGYLGHLFKTIDGGLNWFLIEDSSSTVFPLGFNHSSIHFIDDKYGIAAEFACSSSNVPYGMGCLAVTKNGGITWDIHYFPDFWVFHDIQLWDDKLAFVVGQTRTTNVHAFLVTPDGGDNWFYQRHNPDTIFPALESIFMCSREIGFAVGWSGKIYKTTNSGGELFNAPILSVNDTDLIAGELDIYPNPTKDNMMINISEYETVSIDIFNRTGQLVQKIQMHKSEQCIDISGLNPGTYFIRVNCNDTVFSSKFVIMK